MISSLSGVLSHKDTDHVVLEVAGVGYEVFMPASVILQLPPLGQPLKLEIYTHMSDSQMHLHGFVQLIDKQVFKKLLMVSGVGPKLASTILAALPGSQLVTAITLEDTDKLRAISGVGPKTASRVVMELKDKFKDIRLDAVYLSETLKAQNPVESQVMQALVSLGYSDIQAKRALQGVLRAPEDTLQTLIKKSLGNLAS